MEIAEKPGNIVLPTPRRREPADGRLARDDTEPRPQTDITNGRRQTPPFAADRDPPRRRPGPRVRPVRRDRRRPGGDLRARPRRARSSRDYSRKTLLHQVALFGVLAVGAAVVIISGGIDLSIGSVVALSSIVCAKLLTVWLRDGAAGRGAARRAGRRAGDRADAADGPGDRPLARPDDQLVPAPAVHRHAGDDGRAAEPGGDPQRQQARSTSTTTPSASWATTRGGRWRSSPPWRPRSA